MYYRNTIAFAVCLIVIGLCVYSRYYFTKDAVAKIDYPDLLKIERADTGSLVYIEWTISNTGDKELRIDNIVSSCSCSTIECYTQDLWSVPKDITIPAKRDQLCRVRVLIPTDTSVRAISSIRFNSNDPSRPNCIINIVATQIDGISFVPKQALLGKVLVGERIHREIEIFYTGQFFPEKCIVASTEIEGLDVRFVPASTTSQSQNNSANQYSVGKLHIDLNLKKPRQFDVPISLSFTNKLGYKYTRDFQIQASVIQMYKAFPETVYLPLVSEERFVYTLNGQIRSFDNSDFEVSFTNQPSLRVLSPESKSKDGLVSFTIEFIGDKQIEHTIFLPVLIKNKEAEHTIQIPIHVRPR